VTSQRVQRLEPVACPRLVSHSYLNHLIRIGRLIDIFPCHQPALDGFAQVYIHFVECVALRDATRQGRDFRPIAAFLGLMDYRFQVHRAEAIRFPFARKPSRGDE
jgi:hypothetical protein